MFRRPTVFIIGAGSNVDQGFFLNDGLKSYCADHFQKNYRKYLEENGSYNEDQLEVSNKEAEKLKSVISANLHFNIDHLLSLHPKQENIGKLAIADAILEGERRSIPLSNQVLYQKIFSIMVSDIYSQDQLPLLLENNITFITFNYDRSLEYFLFNQLKQFTDWSTSKVSFEDVFCKLNRVYHVYGSLGSCLPYQNNYVPFGATPTIQTIIDCSSSIDVIYGAKQIRNGNEINTAIKAAEGIFFLGFGYDNANLKILSLPQQTNDKAYVFGTGKGLSPSIRSSMNSIFKKHTHVSNHLPVGNLDCVNFIDRIVVSFTQGRPLAFMEKNKNEEGHIE